MSIIKTAPELANAITATYLIDIAVAVAFFLVMLVVSSLINYDYGKTDNSGRKRRLFFFVLGAMTLFVSLGLNWALFFRNIGIAAFANKYMSHLASAAFLATIAYFIVSFITVKLAKRGKLATIFPKKD